MNTLRAHVFHRLQWLAVIICSVFIASCATTKSPEAKNTSSTSTWTGRISLRTTGHAFQAPQQFSASFVLSGSPSEGELTLGTPLGTTLAKAKWAPGMAQLLQGGDTHVYASMDDLTAALTGKPLPLAAMFGWLQGKANFVNDWVPNLSQLPQGRINATQQSSTGNTDIRIVLDQPDN